MRKKKEFKKKLEDFIKDESGHISRDKVLKVGLGAISVLGMISSTAQTAEHCVHTSHSSY